MDLLKEHASITSIHLYSACSYDGRVVPSERVAVTERSHGGWSGTSAIFCLSSVLVTQVCFLCGNPLSGVLRVYVKLNKNFLEKEAAE